MQDAAALISRTEAAETAQAGGLASEGLQSLAAESHELTCHDPQISR